MASYSMVQINKTGCMLFLFPYIWTGLSNSWERLEFFKKLGFSWKSDKVHLKSQVFFSKVQRIISKSGFKKISYKPII